MALFLGPASVAHAQTTTPTVSTVAITSNPGTNNTYAAGDAITVSVTFSEAVTVTGTPRVTLDIGGQPRYAKYTGAGSATEQTLFGYTVLVGDEDTDGVSLQANSLALNGGTIQATDDSTGATLTHAAMTFANHKVDTEVTLASNLDQPDATEAITISATQSARFILIMDKGKEFDISAIALDVKTPSATLDVTVKLFDFERTLTNRPYREYIYSGSVATAGLQTFTFTGTSVTRFANVPGDADTVQFYFVSISGSGAGSVELVATDSEFRDTGGVSGIIFNHFGAQISGPSCVCRVTKERFRSSFTETSFPVHRTGARMLPETGSTFCSYSPGLWTFRKGWSCPSGLGTAPSTVAKHGCSVKAKKSTGICYSPTRSSPAIWI